MLFQGSHVSGVRKRNDTPEQLQLATSIARPLGDALIRGGFDLIFTGGNEIEQSVAAGALSACSALGCDPRDRVRTYMGASYLESNAGFGMVIQPLEHTFQDVRTLIVTEADAVVALVGGKGTKDCIQKAVLAGKPVFPIAVAGGGAQVEWERLKRAGYKNRTAGDIDFLADRAAKPEEIAARIALGCLELFNAPVRSHSSRVFIVHGRDDGSKNELARMLERLGLVPVILAEQPERGRTILAKLHEEFSDIGYAFVLLTPDDQGRLASSRKLTPRARQNVIFEHGWLIGALGPSRVCALVKDSVELPSDLSGIVYKHIPKGKGMSAVAVELVQELRAAGYAVDANRLLGPPNSA